MSHVANKIAKSVGIISRCSFFLPKTSLLMLYYSLIYPYFYCCNIVGASTYKTNLRRLLILKSALLELFNKSHFSAHIDPIFKDLGILNLCVLAKIHSYLQGLITISLKVINSTLTIQEIPRPTVYHIMSYKH